MINEQILIEAIKNRNFIDFYYDDKPIRKAAPHAIYNSPKGKENVDAYQYEGYSEKGHLPAWRIFTIDKMERIVVLDENFNVVSDYKANSPRYNQYIYKI